MKNKEIKNINDFKKRVKMLYEFRFIDLEPEKGILPMKEDENQNVAKPAAPAPTEQPKQVTPQPSPAPAPSPAPQQTVQQPQNQEGGNDQLISFLKSEMQRLEDVVTSIENISMNVDGLSKRMEDLNNNVSGLTKIVDEIKEPSDIEKLEMRSFDSYPYNKTLNAVWDDIEKSKEEQELAKMGIRKSKEGLEMDYHPMTNMNLNQNSNF
jgi:hypothetical protein